MKITKRVYKIKWDDFFFDLNQPRLFYDNKSLEELSTNLRSNGIMKPALVERLDLERLKAYVRKFPECTLKQEYLKRIESRKRQANKPVYLIVYGTRRSLAARKAGWNSMPSKVTSNLSLEERRALQYQENLHLRLSPEAEARETEILYNLLSKESEKATNKQLASIIGVNPRTVSDRRSYIERLDEKLRKDIESGKVKISFRKAVAVSKLPKQRQYYAACNLNLYEIQRETRGLRNKSYNLEAKVQDYSKDSITLNSLIPEINDLYERIKKIHKILQLGLLPKKESLRLSRDSESLIKKVKEEIEKRDGIFVKSVKERLKKESRYKAARKLEELVLDSQENLTNKPKGISKKYTLIDYSLIDYNSRNPRPKEQEIDELTESLIKFGLLELLLVRKKEKRYEVLGGNRRLRAIKSAIRKNPELKAKLRNIPVILLDREISEKEEHRIILSENVGRRIGNYEFYNFTVRYYNDLLEQYKDPKIAKRRVIRGISEKKRERINLIIDSQNLAMIIPQLVDHSLLTLNLIEDVVKLAKDGRMDFEDLSEILIESVLLNKNDEEIKKEVENRISQTTLFFQEESKTINVKDLITKKSEETIQELDSLLKSIDGLTNRDDFYKNKRTIKIFLTLHNYFVEGAA